MEYPETPIEKPLKAGNALKTKFMFACIYLLFMSARAIFNPFITVYLREKGLDVQWIGIVMGFNSFMIILAQPFWGLIADKLQSVKKVLVICLVGQALISLMFINSESFFVIALCFCIYTFFSSSEGTLLDTWSLHSIKQVNDKNGLGQMKLWGCLGFAASSIISGLFIGRHSTVDIIPVFSVVLIVIGAAVLLIRTGDERDPTLKLKLSDLSLIYKNKTFVVFLFFVMIMQYPHRAAYTFYPALLESLGGSKAMVGYCSAIMFVSEAILLFVSKKLLSKISPKYLIIGSALFFILWQAGYALAVKPEHVMFLSILDGPSFALFTLGTLYYLDAIAPKQLRVTYQTVAYAFYYGISGIIGNTLGGWIIEHYGYRAMYISGIVSILAATVFFIIAEGKSQKGGTVR
ncbi:putative transporter YwbF [Spirochaetia bacterium]|nr:putative transporter YwbF [Spirochaetia bacterium]